MARARRIVLIGPMAVGKSVVGRLVAQRAELAFVDTDRMVTERHGRISTIFETRGEQVFRGFEAAAVRDALDAEDVVVSLGGGAVLHPETQNLLRGRATVVFLDTDLETVRPRIGGDTGRPLLTGGAEKQWQELFDERRPLYESLADVTVDTRGRSARAVADAVLAGEHAQRQPSRTATRTKPVGHRHQTDQVPTEESVTTSNDL